MCLQSVVTAQRQEGKGLQNVTAVVPKYAERSAAAVLSKNNVQIRVPSKLIQIDHFTDFISVMSVNYVIVNECVILHSNNCFFSEYPFQ